MKNGIKILYVIEKAPELINHIDITAIIQNNGHEKDPVIIYIQNEGIRWLLNENWHLIFNPNENIIFYANAKDANDYSVPFQDGVIFSNPKILSQLISWADQVFFIN